MATIEELQAMLERVGATTIYREATRPETTQALDDMTALRDAIFELGRLRDWKATAQQRIAELEEYEYMYKDSSD